MTSFVFPGQGSQFIGMSRDFYDNFDTAKKTFQLVEDITKINIKDIIFENSKNFLDITEYTQLSIFASSLSIFNVLNDEFDINNDFEINYFLGHSLGEYSALCASKFFTIEDCSKLLKIRGNLMQNAFKPNESGMAAILGLNKDIVEKIINENNLSIEIANDNSPIQIVVSGIKKNLLYSENFFLKNNAKKFIYLNVSAAFHSNLMINAQEQLNEYIKKIEIHDPLYSIISNFSAEASNNKEIIVNNLSNQMSNRVRWVESINLLENLNETKIIEIGPGRILSGLIKRISSKFKIFNINKIEDLKVIADEF